LSKALHREFIAQFPTKESRAGLWGFVRAIVDEGTTGVPTTVVWGRADGLVKPMHLERWRSVLPNARFVELADVGDFPQVEAPTELPLPA
jgi:pimeloyl-ACP methyl ester carboxylesterase